jgi:hypothetical protein
MKLQTASAAISFAKRLEEESAKFYQELSQRYAEGSDTFLSFAKENGKNAMQIERTYYGVISDAIESCFAFDIEPDEYKLETTLSENLNYAGALARAIEMEEKIRKFYGDAAEQSKSLMADVPRLFNLIAKKRSDRIAKLKSL